jgi:hypothetical protein
MSNSEDMKSAYAATTHCACAPVAPIELCILGRATFTTVPSMNSMLDPRIVAASTQLFEDSGGPEAIATDVSTSLHGMGPQFIDHARRVGLQILKDKLLTHRTLPADRRLDNC